MSTIRSLAAHMLCGMFVVTCAASSSSAQCTPTWQRTIGMPGLGDGYAGPMAVWNSGSGDQLYVGGSFSTIAGQSIKGIGRWNPATQQWSPVAGGCFSTFTNYFLAAIATHNAGGGTELFAGGSFATAGNVPGTLNIAKFNGTAWSSLGPALNGAVWALASFQGRLYLGGGFTTAGTQTVNGIASWDGEGYSTVGSGMGGGFAPGVFAMKVFNDGSGEKLYVGGRFGSIGGFPGLIARWTGTAWEAVGQGVSGAAQFFGIEAMAVFDSDGAGPNPPELYVGGASLRRNNGPPPTPTSVLKWNGAAWIEVGQDMGGRTTSLAAFDDGSGTALYAGGTAQPGISYFAKLVNNQWVPAFGGVGGTGIPPSNFPSVFGLLSWGDRLVVGGNFTLAGDETNGGGAANGIAFVRGCSVCRADFNRDGVVNSQDFFDFLDAFFNDRPSADFNADGVINSQDFFDFLAVFFVDCP